MNRRARSRLLRDIGNELAWFVPLSFALVVFGAILATQL